MNFFKKLFKPKQTNTKMSRNLIINFFATDVSDFKITKSCGFTFIRRTNLSVYISISDKTLFKSRGIQLFEVHDADLLHLIADFLHKYQQYQDKMIDDEQEAELKSAIEDLEKLRR